MFLKDLNFKKSDKKYLAVILIISTVLTIYYINFSMNIGLFCSDVYVYLVNALYYAGENVVASEDLWLTPLISILTSLFFDFGFKNQLSILIVTGVLAIIGNIGLYLLFRLKFNKPLSFLGVVIYSTFSLNLIWLANGSIDIPAVSLMIWTALFGIMAIDKNPKYYLWTIVLFFLAFLVRYTVVLILPVLLLYFIYKRKYKVPWSELRYLLIPVAVVAICSVVAMLIMYIVTGEVQFLEVGLNLLVGSNPNKLDPAFNLNLFYYIQNFFNFLGSYSVSFFDVSFFSRNPQLNTPTIISVFYGLVMVLGGLIAIKDNRKNSFSRKYIGLTAISAILTALSFLMIHSVMPTFILLFITLILASKISETSNNDLSLMFLGWFLFNFVFFSHLDVKVNRYFIPCLPAVSYFIIYGIHKIQKNIKINKLIIPAILTVVLLFSSFAFVENVEKTDAFIAPQEMSEYIISQHPDYKNSNVASNTIRPYKWYLEQEIFAVRNSQLDSLQTYDIKYYISDNYVGNINNFTMIKNIDGIYLYQRNYI